MNTSAQVMTSYMNDLGSYPRLSREQERALTQAVARGKAAQRELRQTPPPSPKRHRALTQAVTRGQAAQQRLVECNLRLVVYWARRTNPYNLPLEDLIQEGNLGLMAAIVRFDPREGVRLATYAQWWIRKALYRAAADLGPLIRMPERTQLERLRMRRAAARLELSLGRAPTQAELAAELGTSPVRVASMQRLNYTYTSLDAPVGEDDDPDLAEMLPDRSRPSPHETTARRELRARVRQAIKAHLTPDERDYLYARFGLDGGPGRSQLQAAHHLGLTQKHAAQIERRALRQLRQSQTLHDCRS